MHCSATAILFSSHLIVSEPPIDLTTSVFLPDLPTAGGTCSGSASLGDALNLFPKFIPTFPCPHPANSTLMRRTTSSFGNRLFRGRYLYNSPQYYQVVIPLIRLVSGEFLFCFIQWVVLFISAGRPHIHGYGVHFSVFYMELHILMPDRVSRVTAVWERGPYSYKRLMAKANVPIKSRIEQM